VVNILKDGHGGWEIREADRSGASLQEEKLGGLQSSYKASKVLEDGSTEEANSGSDAQLEHDRLAKRSAKYKKLHAERIAARQRHTGAVASTNDSESKGSGSLFPQISIWKRLSDVLFYGLLPHSFTCGDKTKGVGMWSTLFRDPEFLRIAMLAGIVISKTLVSDALALYDGYIVSNVLRSDWSLFVRAVSAGALFRTSLALIDAALVRYKWYLNLGLRKRLTAYLMDLYFKGNSFYDVSNQDGRIKDVEERLTEQVETMCVNLTELWTSLLRPAFDIIFNSFVLARVVGTRGVLSVWGYMAAAGFVMRFAVPNFQANVRETYAREGRFNMVHHRLVNHTESIAFFGGSEVSAMLCTVPCAVCSFWSERSLDSLG